MNGSSGAQLFPAPDVPASSVVNKGATAGSAAVAVIGRPLRIGVERREEAHGHDDSASTDPSPSFAASGRRGRLAGRSLARASTQTTKAASRSNAASTTNSGL